jgi:hypothetical protein
VLGEPAEGDRSRSLAGGREAARAVMRRVRVKGEGGGGGCDVGTVRCGARCGEKWQQEGPRVGISGKSSRAEQIRLE